MSFVVLATCDVLLLLQTYLVSAAALLIQGSACVYGKKVEYLHTLVYQALEFIAEKRLVKLHPDNPFFHSAAGALHIGT